MEEECIVQDCVADESAQKQTAESAKKPKNARKKAFMICFIIGCVFAAYCVLSNITFGGIFFYMRIAFNVVIADSLYTAGIIMVIFIGGALNALFSAVPMALAGIGMKWNRVAGAVTLSVTAASLVFFVIACLVLLFAH